MRRDADPLPRRRWLTRRGVLAGGAAGAVVAATGAYRLRRSIASRLSQWTRLDSFSESPPPAPHDRERDRRTLYVSRGGSPAENIDEVFRKLGGAEALVGGDDVVLVKVSAQWWNQGMTNVAAVLRTLEHLAGAPGFRGEIIVFENVHFRLDGGSGLARAWTRPSERNVGIDGWARMGDLIPHLRRRGAPVSFVGLVDAGPSALSGEDWHDPGHAHGTYGGDGRGPIADGEDRDGYHWSLDEPFFVRRSLVDDARTPLTWPVFTSPASGLVVDLRRGVLRREAGRLVPTGRRLRWITLCTANEHASTGMTAACKSAMGIVDMSAGRLGTHPLIRDYQSVHYFGAPDAKWRMAGPLADFSRRVRAADLYIAVADWVGLTPPGGLPEGRDLRLEEASAYRPRAVVAGADPVAVDAYCAREVLTPLGGGRGELYDLDTDSRLRRFLREYRRVAGTGTLDPDLIRAA